MVIVITAKNFVNAAAIVTSKVSVIFIPRAALCGQEEKAENT